ncbi:hypothetical protein SAMN05518668_12016 [Sphingobium sp. YR657]|nr:hypothetical protein SAMN05518668_12016 [Sphingobium sp. YR657]
MGQLFGQPLALVDVEDGKALEKRNRTCLAILLSGPLFFCLRDKAIGVTNDAPLLALADMATSRFGLPIGQPALAGKAALDHGVPQDQDIDARIAPPGDGVLRHGAGTGTAVPWLHPGKMPRLQFRDDPGGDFAIDALTLDVTHVLSPATPAPAAEMAGVGGKEAHGRPVPMRRAAPAGPQRKRRSRPSRLAARRHGPRESRRPPPSFWRPQTNRRQRGAAALAAASSLQGCKASAIIARPGRGKRSADSVEDSEAERGPRTAETPLPSSGSRQFSAIILRQMPTG